MDRTPDYYRQINVGRYSSSPNNFYHKNDNNKRTPFHIDRSGLHTTSFIGERLNSNFKNSGHSNHQDSVVSKPSQYSVNNQGNHALELKELLKENSINSDISMNNVNYFTDTPTTLLLEEKGNKYPPEGFLVEPYARKGTSRNQFGLAPCGGGLQGQSKYIANPGDKTKVQWIIKNPVKNGLCQIRLSKGHPNDLSTYQTLPVNVDTYDSRNGKFQCGDASKAVEEATVVFPSDVTCSECTLQWIYEAPGYGTLYEWSDISIVSGGQIKECLQPCKNDGVCVDGKCFWAAGYFGEACEFHGKPNMFYESVEPGKTAPVTQNDNSGGGIGFFGWYFILFLIALVIAGIVMALAYFLFRPQTQQILKGKEGSHAGSKDARDSRSMDNKQSIDEKAQKNKEQEDKKKKEDEEKKKEEEEKKKRDTKKSDDKNKDDKNKDDKRDKFEKDNDEIKVKDKDGKKESRARDRSKSKDKDKDKAKDDKKEDDKDNKKDSSRDKSKSKNVGL